MQLKKIAIVFLVVIMMFSLAAIGIAAEEADLKATVSAKVETESSFSPTDVVVKPGTIINYVVKVEASATFGIIDIRVEYDNEALELQEVVYGDLFEEGVQKTVKPDLVQVTHWVGGTSKASGTFFTLKFKVNENFDGDIEKLNISYAGLSDGDNFFECAIEDAADVIVHNLGDATKTPGDCKHVGTTTYKCTHEGCDYELVLHDGVLGDHKWGELNPAIAPTGDKDGVVEHKKCTVCGACCDANGNLLSSIADTNRPEPDNTVVTVIIIVIAVVVVAAGAAAAVVVLKKKKIL